MAIGIGISPVFKKSGINWVAYWTPSIPESPDMLFYANGITGWSVIASLAAGVATV